MPGGDSFAPARQVAGGVPPARDGPAGSGPGRARGVKAAPDPDRTQAEGGEGEAETDLKRHFLPGLDRHGGQVLGNGPPGHEESRLEGHDDPELKPQGGPLDPVRGCGLGIEAPRLGPFGVDPADHRPPAAGASARADIAGCVIGGASPRLCTVEAEGPACDGNEFARRASNSATAPSRSGRALTASKPASRRRPRTASGGPKSKMLSLR